MSELRVWLHVTGMICAERDRCLKSITGAVTYKSQRSIWVGMQNTSGCMSRFAGETQ